MRLIKDLLTHTAGYAPSIEFYNPKLVTPDLYLQDKSWNKIRFSTTKRWYVQINIYQSLNLTHTLFNPLTLSVSNYFLLDWNQVNCY